MSCFLELVRCSDAAARLNALFARPCSDVLSNGDRDNVLHPDCLAQVQSDLEDNAGVVGVISKRKLRAGRKISCSSWIDTGLQINEK